MLERIEAAIAGIEAAIDQGRTLRGQGEHAAASRQAELVAALARIQSLEGRCAKMLADSENMASPVADSHP